MARQTCPEFWNAPSKMPGATFFGSTSSSTMPASLPPSSSVIRFRVWAALAMTFCPVAVEPVNEILRMSGCFVMASPRSLSSVRTLASMATAILVTSLRRSSIGVAAHAGKAALAAATAASSWLFEARGHCASTSSVAGLRTGIVWSPGTIFPSIRRLKSFIGLLSLSNGPLWKSRYIPLYIMTLTGRLPPRQRVSRPKNRLDAARCNDVFSRYGLWNITNNCQELDDGDRHPGPYDMRGRSRWRSDFTWFRRFHRQPGDHPAFPESGWRARHDAAEFDRQGASVTLSRSKPALRLPPRVRVDR